MLQYGESQPVTYLGTGIQDEILWRYVASPGFVAVFDTPQQLKIDLAYRQLVVVSAQTAQFAFPQTGKAAKHNPVYWELGITPDLPGSVAGYNIPVVNSAKTSFAAFENMWNQPTAYCFACANAAEFLQFRGLSLAVNNAQFNGFCKNDIRRSRGAFPARYVGKATDAVAASAQSAVQYAGDGKYDFWIPGDTGIITNKSQKPPELLNGESITYLGGCFYTGTRFATEALFWGHWPGPEPFPIDANRGTRVRTLDEWIRAVAGWSGANGISGAFLQPSRQSLEQRDLKHPDTGAKLIFAPAQ